uniref:Uncharacterized protein LOC111114031 n=1 Tax=Crassostrea virginica TaxID=6565 RepID=A0A8B8BXC2_CRAVI|nr:uncharacterized protein LOC111114031 [Crassostrea virginica]
MENYQSKQSEIRRDLQELESFIFPKCYEALADVPVQKKEMSKHSQELKKALMNQRDVLVEELDAIIQKMHSEIDDMDSKYLAATEKQEYEINNTINVISRVIQDLKRRLDSENICLVSKYKSRNKEFRKLPLKQNVTLPKFQLSKTDRKNIIHLFGSLTPMYLETVEQIYPLQNPEAEPKNWSTLEVPGGTTDIATGYNRLWNMACLSDEEIWTCGNDGLLKLYNLQGDLLKSVNTRSGGISDIAVTRSKDVVFPDKCDKSINIVKNAEIQPVLRLEGWYPHGVCSTFSGDLLVSMNNDNHTQSKVVRYTDFKEKQSIQFNDHGYPLFTSLCGLYLTENRNLDICVADINARAVVVVNAAGKLRFRYTGHMHISGIFLECTPVGIATDSQGRILIAEIYNYSIHILDQDGHFLRYFNKVNDCYLNTNDVFGLCVDSNGNLFLGGHYTGNVKKIQYST